uniref:Uncharacterized protein n=1 Tax=Caenorhabditis japonica TaxID=281687 RepID=A0A8R1EX74_CAEJA
MKCNVSWPLGRFLRNFDYVQSFRTRLFSVWAFGKVPGVPVVNFWYGTAWGAWESSLESRTQESFLGVSRSHLGSIVQSP